MKNIKNFPFEKSRRITLSEINSAKKAIEEKTGQKRIRALKILKNNQNI